MKGLPLVKATVTAFLGASSGSQPSGMWGLSRVEPQRPPSCCPSSFASGSRGRSSSVRMMHEVLTGVSPELLVQLAGCAVMVSTGKMLQIKEEEEGIEPVAPWALEEDGEEGRAVDLYRDTAVRYFGYANEVGEAFRPVVTAPLVTFSYLVAFAYIAADSYSQGAKVVDPSSGGWKKPSVLASIDSLLFQFMASVIFPSFTINRWVTFLGAALAQLPEEQLSSVPAELVQYLPTATGLIIIPIICGPLDVLTHRLLDNSFRSVSERILTKDR